MEENILIYSIVKTKWNNHTEYLFECKDLHKYTSQVLGREERYVLDYVGYLGREM